MSYVLRKQKDEDILVKVPFSDLVEKVQDQINDAVGKKPPVTIKATLNGKHDWRLEVDIDMSNIHQIDQDHIMERVGYAEGEPFDNGDRLMEEVFNDIQDTYRVGIDGVYDDGRGECLLVHMPLKEYKNVMSK